MAFAIFGALEQHVDDVAGLHGNRARLVEEFVNLDETFGLVADVDDDVGLGDLEHRALDHLAFRHVAEAVVVDPQQRVELLLVHVFVEHRLERRTGGLTGPRACRCSGLCRPSFRARPTRYLHSPFRARPPRTAVRLSQGGCQAVVEATGFCCGDRPPAAITAMDKNWVVGTHGGLGRHPAAPRRALVLRR